MVMVMREKLIEVMKDTRANAAWHRWGYEESADYLIENNVVPVVRCMNCKHCIKTFASYTKIACIKGVNWRAVEPNHFCSYGEMIDMDGGVNG